MQRLTQYFVDADRGCPLSQLGTAVAAHEDYWNGRRNLPDLTREFGSNQIRHRLVGENEIKALRVDSEGLQRRAT